jgi:hypothetical protein
MSRRWSALLFASLGALGLGCGAEPGEAPPPSSSVGGSGGAGGGSGLNPLGRPRCQPPAGTTGSPGTIEEAVQLLNALPKPTSAACFVESLDRPILAYATSSPFSAQPALSKQSPRVFLQLGQLWASVVMDGESSYLIEFSYLQADMLSIKAEVMTPLEVALTPSAPYERVRMDGGTACGFCHYSERRAVNVTFAEAFESIAFQPRPATRVSIEGLAAEARACDVAIQPHRCEMLSALFDGGQVIEQPFPSGMPTFY